MTAVLGLDTATPVLTVAVTRDGELLRAAEHGPDDAGHPRASELLLGEVERCVEAASGWDGVGLIAVGVGPGSYTGLRIGIATARALAQARELPVAGVSTLAGLARGIREREGEPSEALPLIDARRGQVFAALYGHGGEEIWAPMVIAPEELADRVRALGSNPLSAGDGSVRFREELGAAGAEIAPPNDTVHRVAARHICALAEGAAVSPPDRIEPVYLRAPDAEKWQQRDQTPT
jgi:tRNA threonylcarbamoyladenosine biosynthesis protein TsaB